MLTATERNQMIAKIRGLPSSVEAAVKDLNDKQLDTPYREGGWTVRQVVHHLADSHMNAFVRAKLTLTEEKPTLNQVVNAGMYVLEPSLIGRIPRNEEFGLPSLIEACVDESLSPVAKTR